MGGPEILILLLIFGVPVWALIDIATRPEESFAAVGRNKTNWVVLMIVGIILIFPLAFVAALVYLIAVRPKLGSMRSAR